MSESIKVVAVEEMTRLERKAISEGADEESFMEEAGEKIACFLEEKICAESDLEFLVLCGRGNNGGDGYVIARKLQLAGQPVKVFSPYAEQICSPLCRQKRAEYERAGGILLSAQEAISLLCSSSHIIDALLGTGFRSGRALAPELQEWIGRCNDRPSSTQLIAVDIPSGLDGNDGSLSSLAMRADHTCTLELPKLGLFIREGWQHSGTISLHSFGLQDKYLEEARGVAELLIEPCVALPYRRDQHKYLAGEVRIVAGWGEMEGAAILAGMAALRSGAGLARLYHSPDWRAQRPIPPELLSYSVCSTGEILQREENSRYSRALLMGPGMGREQSALSLLRQLLGETTFPTVVDADAIYAYACMRKKEEGNSSQLLFTPHRGELRALLSYQTFPEEEMLWRDCQQFVQQSRSILLLKGAPSLLFSPDHLPFIQPCGSAGMATAGSGDVLSGVIAALLARGIPPWKAALWGSYLHGRAGEIAVGNQGVYGLIASDLVEALPTAFLQA